MPTLPIVVPNAFLNQAGPIPLVQLDQDLGTMANTVNSMANGTVQIPMMAITTANVGVLTSTTAAFGSANVAGAITGTSFTGNVVITGGTAIVSGANVTTLNVSSIPALTGNAGVTITQGPASITVSGTAASALTNSLAGDVALNNTANYFDGPTANVTNSGTWFASGTVTVNDTGASADFDAKLWDGTTVIASCETQTNGATQKMSMSLSGVITNPAAAIRISVKDKTNTTGNIKFNLSGNSKDSTITAYRIG